MTALSYRIKAVHHFDISCSHPEGLVPYIIGSKGFENSNLVFVAARVRKSCVREQISLKPFTLEKKMRMITIV